MPYANDATWGSPLSNKAGQVTHYGCPMWATRNLKVIRPLDKAISAGHLHRIKVGQMPAIPKTAITLRGWAGSNPQKEFVRVWSTGKQVVIVNPVNDKGLILDLAGEGKEFVGPKYRPQLGLAPAKAKPTTTKKVVKANIKKHKKVIVRKHRAAA